MRQNRLIGRQVAGRFTIKRFLGEGGMATVFLAEQAGEPREVALKIMNEELNADRNFVKRFQREAKAAARVQHPNSVTFIDYGVADGLSYIAMELLRGDDLYVLLERDGAISQLRAARILVEVCDALSVAHELGIVHRDLKPENIMVIADAAHPNGERVKVLDFGIAKLLGPEASTPAPPVDPDREPPSGETRAGTFIGTPSYMSPEQCALRPVDTRADLYTCGVLLFQLVTGRLPFEGQTPLHTANLHIHEAPPRPSTFAPSLDPRIEAVILKALAKKPADRHQTARHMASMLRKILPDLPDVRVALAGKPSGPLRPSGRTRNVSALEGDGAGSGSSTDTSSPDGGSRLQGAARIRPAAGGLPAPVVDDEDTGPRRAYDSERTLVRPPADDDAAPRNRELTEVMPPSAEVGTASYEGGSRPQTPSYDGASHPQPSPLLGPPSPLSPGAPNKLPPRPPPRAYKPTLKSAGVGGLGGLAKPAGAMGEPAAAPQPPASPSTLIGMAPKPPAPKPPTPPADAPPDATPLEGAPVVSVGGPSALGALQLGSAQLTTAQPGRAPPAEPAVVEAAPAVSRPEPATNAFDETTKMEVPELPPYIGFIPTAQTVPLIPPDLVASVIARGPPRPAAGAPAVAPAPAPTFQGGGMPMGGPMPPMGGAVSPLSTMPSASQGFAPPSAQGYAPSPPVQGYAPTPPVQGYAPLSNQGQALLPQTPPVYPVAAAPAEGARISSARGLLLGFLAGAVLMAIVAAAYFLTH